MPDGTGKQEADMNFIWRWSICSIPHFADTRGYSVDKSHAAVSCGELTYSVKRPDTSTWSNFRAGYAYVREERYILNFVKEGGGTVNDAIPGRDAIVINVMAWFRLKYHWKPANNAGAFLQRIA